MFVICLLASKRELGGIHLTQPHINPASSLICLPFLLQLYKHHPLQFHSSLQHQHIEIQTRYLSVLSAMANIQPPMAVPPVVAPLPHFGFAHPVEIRNGQAARTWHHQGGPRSNTVRPLNSFMAFRCEFYKHP